MIQADYEMIFDDSDGIIDAAIKRMEELSKSQQQDGGRIKGELVEIDRKIGSMMGLMIDPDFDPVAKRALSRQRGELEQRREQLNGAMANLAEAGVENTAKFTRVIRQALEEARASLASITTPAEFNRFVARFVGPVSVGADGVIQRIKNPGRMLSHPTGDIAGGGFEPPTSGL